MTTTTKVLIGVGVLAAIGAVWYISTLPKASGTLVVNRPAASAIPSSVATDLVVASTAATIAEGIANTISNDNNGSDDSDDSMSGVNYYQHPRFMTR